jgi:succinyl-diaminopimelate desuccinylase
VLKSEGTVPYNPIQFAEKYRLAWEAALKGSSQGGISGFELEWNLLDSQLQPLLTVGAGPAEQSFVDYLREQILPEEALPYSQLEVFHWMIEWATRPYYHLKGSLYESRIMEAVLINALHQAGQEFGEPLYSWHGNLLYPVQVGHDSIPGAWGLAKRRYLERCVDLYGNSLATAGIHSNLSLPEPLMALDFMHLTPTERGDRHFDDYKSSVYILGSRLLRAFSPLFIATSASTPLKAGLENGSPVVYLTDIESVRSLTFPNPIDIDAPDLYRSYTDYLHISYDLVRQGIRFGNNNWTPVRARSFAEPVERLISITSEQLEETYARGLYSLGKSRQPLWGERSSQPIQPVEEMARQIEIQNLLARINLPMARVEVRTDDGGGSLELDIANLTFKYLLLLHSYADPEFGRSFRYDAEDIQRARRNEEKAARKGLQAEIENPFSGKPVSLKEFLVWSLAQIKPLAEALDLWNDLNPLVEMSSGAPSISEKIRRDVLERLECTPELPCLVPTDILKEIAIARQNQVSSDVQTILDDLPLLGEEASRLNEILLAARKLSIKDPLSPIELKSRRGAVVSITSLDKTQEIVELAKELIRIPSVTACPDERLGEVQRAHEFITCFLHDYGLPVRIFNRQKYPAILSTFPRMESDPLQEKVMLSGHFDVVEPEPDDSQFLPVIEGDYLLGRGSADMKTVVATYLVWMKDVRKRGGPYPPISLLLIGNEENGEAEPYGTPHVLAALEAEGVMLPELLIAGERTGEKGNEIWGEICIENRGVMRLEIAALGEKGHSGTAGKKRDLLETLTTARKELDAIFKGKLTLHNQGGWQSQVHYPFLLAGTQGIYNITPARGILGIEIRPVPQDDIIELEEAVSQYCHENGLELKVVVKDGGIACNPENPYFKQLINAVRLESGSEPMIGKKLPATSARFSPHGQGVVWGQTGIGPHSRYEKHYIPSILPYYQALDKYGHLLSKY